MKITKAKPHLVFLMDASSSMSGQRQSVVDTFNEYIDSVKSEVSTISLYSFNNLGIKEIFNRKSPDFVNSLHIADYSPQGMTPLYDAVGTLILDFENNDNVQFVVHTDGAENCSKEFNFNSLNKLIKDKTNKGWLFVYLGEGLEGSKEIEKFTGLKVNFGSANRSKTMTRIGEVTRSYSATSSSSASSYTNNGSDTINIDP